MFEVSNLMTLLEKEPYLFIVKYEDDEYCVPKHRNFNNHVSIDKKSIVNKVILTLWPLSRLTPRNKQLQDITFYKITGELPIYTLTSKLSTNPMSSLNERNLFLVSNLGNDSIQVKTFNMRPKCLELELYVASYTIR